jgi:hypothetical protein
VKLKCVNHVMNLLGIRKAQMKDVCARCKAVKAQSEKCVQKKTGLRKCVPKSTGGHTSMKLCLSAARYLFS